MVVHEVKENGKDVAGFEWNKEKSDGTPELATKKLCAGELVVFYGFWLDAGGDKGKELASQESVGKVGESVAVEFGFEKIDELHGGIIS